MARISLEQWHAEHGVCGHCHHLDPVAINPGVHYCHRFKLWRMSHEEPACHGWSPKQEGPSPWKWLPYRAPLSR